MRSTRSPSAHTGDVMDALMPVGRERGRPVRPYTPAKMLSMPGFILDHCAR
jgi:hypothetical protein